MKTLHLINKPGQPFTLCQRVLADNDALMLIEDGTYLLSARHACLKQAADQHAVYALDADVSARGIAPDIEAVSPISYRRFVALTAEYDQVISWF